MACFRSVSGRYCAQELMRQNNNRTSSNSQMIVKRCSIHFTQAIVNIFYFWQCCSGTPNAQPSWQIQPPSRKTNKPNNVMYGVQGRAQRLSASIIYFSHSRLRAHVLTHESYFEHVKGWSEDTLNYSFKHLNAARYKLSSPICTPYA